VNLLLETHALLGFSRRNRPVWQLRVGDYPVFYDVDDSEHTVYIRAVREKKTDQTTEDIIQ